MTESNHTPTQLTCKDCDAQLTLTPELLEKLVQIPMGERLKRRGEVGGWFICIEIDGAAYCPRELIEESTEIPCPAWCALGHGHGYESLDAGDPFRGHDHPSQGQVLRIHACRICLRCIRCQPSWAPAMPLLCPYVIMKHRSGQRRALPALDHVRRAAGASTPSPSDEGSSPFGWPFLLVSLPRGYTAAASIALSRSAAARSMSANRSASSAVISPLSSPTTM